MRKTLFCTGVLALAFTVGCTQQRGSERAENAGGTASGDQTQSERTSATATAPGDDAAMRDTSKLTQDDRQFVQHAAQGGMMEVQLGQLAQEKGQSDAVKQLGQTLANDHQQANQRLQQIAQAKQIDVSTDMGQKHQQQMSKLQNQSGAAFDRAFLQAVIQEHQRDITEFRSQSNQTQDTALRDFTTSTLPTLEQHLQQAREAQQSAGKSK
jgi:putative membrane protein